MRSYIVLALVSASLVLSGCAQQNLTGSSYSRTDARKVQTVQYAIVQSVTPVIIDGRTDGFVGAGAGAIVGGLTGSTIGGGRGSSIATVLGAVAGGVAGQKLEESATREQGQEITLRLESGQTISVVQAVENNMFFQPGDSVRVLSNNGAVRVSY